MDNLSIIFLSIFGIVACVSMYKLFNSTRATTSNINMPDIKVDISKKLKVKNVSNKENFISDFKSKSSHKTLIVWIELPNKAVDMITSNSNIMEKYQYYLDNYDSDLVLRRNSDVKMLTYYIG